MTRYSKESIQRLRQAVDIVDLISRYVPLKRAGASFKGLCPFHDEKSPSFTVSKNSGHYHCFGCHAHGDALAFLMQYERLSFQAALELLSERSGVILEVIEGGFEEKGVPKARLKQVLEQASFFFQTMLLHSEEAAGAREYLRKRNLSLSFLKWFGIGYAPLQEGLLFRFLKTKGFFQKEMEEAGLLVERGGMLRDFFQDRITFPILDVTGATIGFSARKFKEETFGGKYINTQETSLFKKSRVLFGLFYSKKRMVKERIACLVEGQLDALRLIEAGFDFTVATLGTAFGLPHVEQLKGMGVEEVYLSFDQDKAGQESLEKAGNLLMKRGIGVSCVSFQEAKDPDELLQKKGKEAFFEALSHSKNYLEFLVEKSQRELDWKNPVEKDKAVQTIASMIREWENPILVHETLKRLALLANIPETLLRIDSVSPIRIRYESKKEEKIEEKDFLLELDVLRWLVFVGKEHEDIALFCKEHLSSQDFHQEVPRKLYAVVLEKLMNHEPIDFLSFLSDLDLEGISSAIDHLFSRKTIPEKAHQTVYELVKKIKERNWLQERDLILKKMQEEVQEEKLVELAKVFDELKKKPPEIPLLFCEKR